MDLTISCSVLEIHQKRSNDIHQNKTRNIDILIKRKIKSKQNKKNIEIIIIIIQNLLLHLQTQQKNAAMKYLSTKLEILKYVLASKFSCYVL